MDAIATGQNIGSELLKALGLNDQFVTGVTIEICSNSVVEVTVTRYVGKDEFDKLIQMTSHYRLVPKDGDMTPVWCGIHQSHGWCEHNGGVFGASGWESPDARK